MYEVEVKVRADHDRVRRRLDEVGASALGTVEQEDTYFDAPHRSFAARDEALRIRVERAIDDESDGEWHDESDSDGDVRVTYKGPMVDDASKTRREMETAVGDHATMREILTALGFEPVATVEKVRERFDVDGYVVTLDTVVGLGEFVEVETDASQADVDAARDGAFAVLTSLDLDPDDQIRTSYLELLLDRE